MVGLLLSIVVGLIPTVIYGGFVNWLDQHEKEPWWLLTLAFVWGTVPAAAIALVAQWVLDIPTTWVFSGASLAYEILGSGVWAPITEEVAKGLGVVIILLLARREMDSVLDGIIYGAMTGLGFALTENVLYFGTALAEDGWGSWAIVVLLRTIPFGLNHALFSGLTGAGHRGNGVPASKSLGQIRCSPCRTGSGNGLAQDPQPGCGARASQLLDDLRQLSL